MAIPKLEINCAANAGSSQIVEYVSYTGKMIRGIVRQPESGSDLTTAFHPGDVSLYTVPPIHTRPTDAVDDGIDLGTGTIISF
jgi:hypothetical protein